jgi:hypothetical protein
MLLNIRGFFWAKMSDELGDDTRIPIATYLLM